MFHVEHEEWRIVPSKPDLMASSLGRVHRTIPRKKGPKPKPTYGYAVRQVRAGLVYAKLTITYQPYGRLLVSRLVCEAFHGPAPFDGAVVMHIDDNSLRNEPGNLRWATQRENLNSPTTKAKLDAARIAMVRARMEARQAA